MYTYIFPKLLPHIGMGLFQGLFSIQLIILERGGGGGVERVLFQNTVTSNDILKFCYDQIFDIHFFTFSCTI